MRKLYKTLLSCLCLTAIVSTGWAMSAYSSTDKNALEPTRIYGPVTKTDNQTLSIDNQSGGSYAGEIIINISDQTRILDAVSGLPVAYDDLRNGETAYIYIGPAMTMSLPPMTNASMILCNIPADYKVPEYLTVESMAIASDGVSGTLTTAGGSKYTIPADAQFLPYLTRNIVRIQDLTPGATCLIWSDAQNRATKVVIFPEASEGDSASIQTDWVQTESGWTYYDENGALFTGWLQDNGSWYYLNPSTGIMHTGFLSLEGKTYYLQADGKMLTKSKSFTPDAQGVLH